MPHNAARVIDTSKLATDKVLLYSSVQIKNIKTDFTITYTLVPESESDISQKKISISSPIAKGLLSKKVGEIANITTPSGVLAFKIINIYRD